jgi:hypothetical protein
MTTRYFTVAEANALLPRIQEAVEQVQEGNRRLAALSSRLFPEGQPQADSMVGPAYLASLMHLTAGVDAIVGMGGQVKDLGTGLVDFPSLFKGREVLLCWMPGEATVGYWHDTDVGFAGRAAIDNENDFHGSEPPVADRA